MQVEFSPQILIERLIAASHGKEIAKGGTHILIACMPKSGSTFLSTVIANIPGMNNVTLTFGYSRREQELCPLSCSLQHDLNYVAQHHVRYSEATQKLLTSFNIFPVILMRNIFDCVVSMFDHLHNESLEQPMAYVPPHILRAPKEKQFDLIIDFVVPWYANFFACWSEYHGKGLRFMYRHMIRDVEGTIAQILKQAGFETSSGIIEEAALLARSQSVRFNIGKVGRGVEQLSGKQIARIEELFSHYSHLKGVNDVLYRGTGTD